MSGYDRDFRFLLEIDEDERRAALGEHIQAMLDDTNAGKEDPAHAIFEAVGRAKLARETEGDE